MSLEVIKVVNKIKSITFPTKNKIGYDSIIAKIILDFVIFKNSVSLFVSSKCVKSPVIPISSAKNRTNEYFTKLLNSVASDSS